tara:strand:- start:857 stop:1099 length:243 start_codon:yes stop_codon:yes gene_type:complete
MTRTEYYWTVKDITNDLKYLMRLTSRDFRNLLFPNSEDEDYVRGKWEVFAESPLRFIWSCSEDKLEIISEYIQDIKREEG